MRRKKKTPWDWIPVVFAAIVALAGLLLWLSSQRGEKTDADHPEMNISIPTGEGISTVPSVSATEPDDPDVIGPGEAYRPNNRPVMPTEPTPEVEVSAAQLTFDRYSRYSGPYVEDGKDQLVENVAAILVTNRSDRFLQVATIAFRIDGKDATFNIMDLPAGASAWVLEAGGMIITEGAKFEYLNAATGFLDDVVASTDDIKLTDDGNILTAVNQTDTIIKGVQVYYKLLHSDGNYLGGITYMVNFGDLEPGTSVEKLAGHFGEDAQIVRIGWQS